MADYIPLKIQTEIMKRLPVIPLIRFRSVSKKWKSIIDSPEFIARHCVIQSKHHLLLSYLESGVSHKGYVVRYKSIVDDDDDDDDDDDTFRRHHNVLMTTPMSVSFFSQQSSFVAVSGGLFCMYGSVRNVMNAVIWNPSIRKSVTIPVPNAPDNDDDVWYNSVVGFWVCPQTSDPKLVKISYNTTYEEEYATIPNQVEVFSLSSGLWTPLPTGKLPRKSLAYINPQVAINQFIYWLVHDKSSPDWKHHCCRLIMSFDFTTEEFTEVYLPPALASFKTHVSISKLNQSLVVIEKTTPHSNANVWIMQNGDPPSFIHLFTINMPILSTRDVAGFTNGAPLLSQKQALQENELIVYDPNSKQINHTGIAGPFHYFFASSYTQTLLLLDHKGMEDYIPLKIQTEIMKRLPVIPLIRFRSVSKKWKSIIDSPEFIAQHCVIQSKHHLLLSYLESGVSSRDCVARYFSIVDDDTFPHQKVFMTTPVSVNRLNYPAELVGVSGGLFCFYGSIREGLHNAVFWNPSIMKTVTIPVPNVPDVVPLYTMVGFSVCPRTSDPKLVKITYISRYQEEYPTIPNQVEVFSLSSGLWKPLPTGKLPLKPIVYMYPQVPINDSIYWLAYDKSDCKDQQYSRFIMSFDFTAEEFTEVYLPPTLASSNTHDVSISKLNQSLVVIEKTTPHSNANVWIMQNGDPPSFIHLLTIDMPILSTRDVAGFTTNGAPLLSQKQALQENELIVYDPNSKQINHTGIAGPCHYFFAGSYTQTLLLLDHKDSVDSETKQGRFRRLGRTLKGVTTSSSATSSSTSYYGASKRYSQEEVDELLKKSSKRILASVNKKLDNLMTQLAEKGISLDKSLVIGEEDEEYEISDDEQYLDSDDEELDEELEWRI